MSACLGCCQGGDSAPDSSRRGPNPTLTAPPLRGDYTPNALVALLASASSGSAPPEGAATRTIQDALQDVAGGTRAACGVSGDAAEAPGPVVSPAPSRAAAKAFWLQLVQLGGLDQLVDLLAGAAAGPRGSLEDPLSTVVLECIAVGLDLGLVEREVGACLANWLPTQPHQMLPILMAGGWHWEAHLRWSQGGPVAR